MIKFNIGDVVTFKGAKLHGVVMSQFSAGYYKVKFSEYGAEVVVKESEMELWQDDTMIGCIRQSYGDVK